jgi:hypothetical protein
MGNPIIRFESNTLDTSPIKHMIATFENYFHENSVYKTLLICETDGEVYEIAKELHNKDHSVSVLYYDDIYDERDKYLNFNTNLHRIFIMSYLTWYTLNSEIKVYLLPHQNLVALASIGEIGNKCIKNWLYDAKLCGFVEGTPRILELYDAYNDTYDLNSNDDNVNNDLSIPVYIY